MTYLQLLSFRRLIRNMCLGMAALLFSIGMARADTTRFVVKDNPAAEAPYTNWPTAAARIQDAIDASLANDLVLVSNGVYDAGFSLSDDGVTNRIVVPDGVTVQSVNGPDTTILQGEAGVRCAALVGSARLVGFGLTGAQDVGGVWGEDISATLETCWIYGNSAPRGGGAQGVVLIGCLLRANTATLRGGGAFDCSLQDCRLIGNSAENGGGASESFLWNCMVTSNTASENGGGAYESALRGCLVVGNSANQGGGTSGGDLASATVCDNQASVAGGGVYDGFVINSIVHGNHLADATSNDWTGSSMQYSLSNPQPDGDGNQTGDPAFVNSAEGNFRLQADSPCINTGTNQPWMAEAIDLDGNPRIIDETVDIGAYEYVPLPVSNPQLEILGLDDLPIANEAEPNAGAGTTWVSRTGQNAAHTFCLTNAGNAALLLAGCSWSGSGTNAFSVQNFPLTVEPGASQSFIVVFHPDQAQVYEATLNIDHSASNTASPFVLNFRCEGVLPANRYVALNNPGTAPYTNWATAAPDIQSAIDVSRADDTIWVSNGLYETGSKLTFDDVLNRVAVTNAIVIRSVNGPGTTAIRGEAGVRCVYLCENSSLIGFAVTNGLDAGGIWCADETALVSNCVVSGNSASVGGGVCNGTIRNCVIAGNSADNGGGVFNAFLFDCELTGNTATESGGGAYDCELHGCLLSSNTATESGGGASSDSVLYNCVLRENAAQEGGGSADSTLYSCGLYSNNATYGGGSRGGNLHNCTVVGNSASTEGGGAYNGELMNCIVYFNTRGMVEDNVASSDLSYSCTTPLPPGMGNIDADPLFQDPERGDYRLATNSLCINAGTHQLWMDGTLDLGGELRVVGPAVDMGAHEHPFTPSGIPAAWLKDNDLPWDGSADEEDADTDGFSNWKEWRAETNPKDPLSLLALERPATNRPPDGIGWIVRWQSVTGKVYSIERSMDLPANPSFLPLADSIPGQSGFTTYTDCTATATGPAVYRIRLP